MVVFHLNSYLKFKNILVRTSYRNISTAKLKPPWKVMFFGNDEFSIYSLQKLIHEYRIGNIISKLEVCTSIKKNKNVVCGFSEKEKLKLHNWPVTLVKKDFDVGLVVSFGHLIPKEVISAFPYGIINVHASLLPRWRGAAPIIYSIANGDSKTGVSIMKINASSFDTGKILYQESVDISQSITMPELHKQLGELGANALVKCLKNLPDMIEKAIPQSNENVLYAPKIKPEFANIQWDKMSSKQIFDLQRALCGFLTVSATWKGEQIKLYDITVIDEDITLEKKPGYINYDSKLNILKVLCLDNKFIGIKKVKPYSRKTISASDFNNGFLKNEPDSDRYFK